ncbi:MAG: NAD-dependent deacylase [Candidatus Hermodarchaeota archaeon]|nr:NAD-dependent deacylase [Candidatus Hermodarchaeota archaeon]
MLDEKIQQVAQMISTSTSTVALTGAGVSTKSGIPDFRGPDGLWTKVDPAKFASINGFLSDPRGWWEMALEMAPTIMNAKPNPSHIMLAKLEKMGLLDCLITQNVDGLHQIAGSKNVIEVHGSLFSATCTVCQIQVDRKHLENAMRKRQIPIMCPTCGGLLKLDTVFFGEALPQKALGVAVEAARKCELMLAVGSYLVVYPVATLPTIATQSGAKFIIINQEPTPLDQMADLVFHAEAGETLTQIVKAIKT